MPTEEPQDMYISAELGSDHFQIIANIDVKPNVLGAHRKVIKRYDVDKLCDRETRQEFQVIIGGAFELGPVEEL